MKLLLDTHIFLWFISGDKRLPPTVAEAITNFNNQVYVSVVSIWEAIIKQQLGKLPLPAPAETYLPMQRERHALTSLEIHERTVQHLATLPPLHRDPFDRILICQALADGLILVTADSQIKAYPVATL